MCYRKYPFNRDTRRELFSNITHGRIIPESFNRTIDPILRKFILDLLEVDHKKRLG